MEMVDPLWRPLTGARRKKKKKKKIYIYMSLPFANLNFKILKVKLHGDTKYSGSPKVKRKLGLPGKVRFI